MLLTISLFEIKYRFRQVSTYIFYALLLALSCFFASNSLMTTGGIRVHENAPYPIVMTIGRLAQAGTVMVSAIMGTAIYRDFESGAFELFFTTRVSKSDYYMGRFLGSSVVTLAVFSSIIAGLMLGPFMPWADRSKLVSFHAWPYVYGFFVFILPNLALTGVLFFTFGALTRSLFAIYVQGVALYVGSIIAATTAGTLENKVLGGLIDPFGTTAASVLCRYWTVVERNSQLVPLTGVFLWNRVLWLGVAAIVFAVGYRLFSFSSRAERIPSRQKPQVPLPGGRDRSLRTAPQSRRLPPGLAIWFRLTRFYFVDTVRGAAFLIIALLGILLFVDSALQADKQYGTPVYPVARIMAATIAGDSSLFNLILIAFLAGELVWRERVLRASPVVDALPVSTDVVILSKFTVVTLIQAMLFALLILVAMGFQASQGFYRFEPAVYLTYIYGLTLPRYACWTAMAFFVQALVNNKFLGHLLFLLIVLGVARIPGAGVDHSLFLFAHSSGLTYSDMAGFGPFLAPNVTMTLYSLLFSVLLGVAASLLWVRGVGTRLRERLRLIRQRWRSRSIKCVALAASLGFVLTGAFIFRNTNVLNTYQTNLEYWNRMADYERFYKARVETIPQPRITDVDLNVDLFPAQRRYRVRGVYTLRNRTNMPVSQLPMNIDSETRIASITFDRPADRVVADKRLGFYVYSIAPALMPGQTMRMTFDIAVEHRGFPNGYPDTSITGNGTFLRQVSPYLGYSPGREITESANRKWAKLPFRRLVAPLTDQAARANTNYTSDADWINFEATVSTDPDQIAIAPGSLLREWRQNGRRYFHYRTEAPILDATVFLSARYAVRRDTWTNGKQTVAIEIYYNPDHIYNLDSMTNAVKRSLDYYTANYSPYQFQQVRIVEFPAFQTFAQSFPGTIPFSEGMGFIARVRKGVNHDIDYPFFVTAHEVAHQWWGHQVAGANVEGSDMLSESLAEYSALMVMEKTYGSEDRHRFLRYELDAYLAGRSQAREDEVPLMRCTNQQYIHYYKGALAFYALRDYIGEKRLNAVLSQFVHDKGFQNPPYTTSEELVERLRAATPPELRYLIADLFETITLYDNKAERATYRKIEGGRYRVTLAVDARKLRATGTGKESEIPIRDYIDIGVFANRKGLEPGRALFCEKRLITQPKTVFTLDVKELPGKAGIDPYNKLIDRTPDDNTVTVTAE